MLLEAMHWDGKERVAISGALRGASRIFDWQELKMNGISLPGTEVSVPLSTRVLCAPCSVAGKVQALATWVDT
jgi:hypothetical protein